MIRQDPGFSVARGDPGQIAQAAAWHQELADAFELHQATIHGEASAVLSTWNGEAANTYSQLSTMVAAHFGAAAFTSRTVAAELGRYSKELDRCQTDGMHALHESEHWLAEQNTWQQKLDDANKAIAAAQAEIRSAQSTLSNPLMSAPLTGAPNPIAQAQLSAGRADRAKAQSDQRTAQRQLEQAEHQVVLWQGRGRRAFEDAVAAAQQATGAVDGIEIVPPPLVGYAVPDRFNTPPPPPPPKPHHSWLHNALHDVIHWGLRGAATLESQTPGGQALSLISLVSRKTVGICGGVDGNIDVFGAQGSVCYDATPDGESGITVTGGAGPALPGAGAGVSIGPMVSNGKTLSDQGGPFTYAQGSAGEGPYSGGGSVSYGQNAKGRVIVDGGVAWTPSISDGVSGQVGESYTWTFPAN